MIEEYERRYQMYWLAYVRMEQPEHLRAALFWRAASRYNSAAVARWLYPSL